jgi:hypothetical protein
MKKYLCVLVVCLLTSCKTYYVQNRMPILDKPNRPELVNIPGAELGKLDPNVASDISKNFIELLKYGKQLEVTIDTYNKFASEENSKLSKGE